MKWQGLQGGDVSWCAAFLGEGQVREVAGRPAVPGPQISVNRRVLAQVLREAVQVLSGGPDGAWAAPCPGRL